MSFLIDLSVQRKRLTWLALIPAGAFLTVIACMALHVNANAANGAFSLVHELSILGVGIFLFVKGFQTLTVKWSVDYTPTSTIRGVAMGRAEIAGIAVKKFDIISPLSGTACVYYRYMIEQKKRGTKGRTYWDVIEQGRSSYYFYVQDATGTLLVDPLNSETILPHDYRKTNSTATYRYTEWYICPGDTVYILGSVTKVVDPVNDHREKIVDALRALKADRARLMTFDADGDGTISAAEWDTARGAVETEVLTAQMAAPPTDDIMIAKGPADEPFIISDQSEQAVSRTLGWRCIGYIVGGILLILGMCASMLAHAGLLPAALAIHWSAFYR